MQNNLYLALDSRFYLRVLKRLWIASSWTAPFGVIFIALINMGSFFPLNLMFSFIDFGTDGVCIPMQNTFRRIQRFFQFADVQIEFNMIMSLNT